MNQEMNFFLKVIRNGFILAGMYFVSVFAVGELSWLVLKPVVIFFMTYLFTEMGRRYKLAPLHTKTKITPMVF